jgi:multisubunit Na+/H+ antiporter MnhB subunit
MKARHLLALVFALPALGSAYLAWLMWREGDGGKWLFIVFAIFFGLIAATPWLPKTKPKPEPLGTRFVPHWFMLAAIATILVAVLASIVAAILRNH